MIPAFVPHPLLRGGQLQTLAAQFTSTKAEPLDYTTLQVALSDGDSLLVHVDKPRFGGAEAPVVALFHGLGGCSDSDYNLRISAKLTARGFRVARFNHRGCGNGGMALARKIYHSGAASDLTETLTLLSRRWPNAPLLAVGFSLSANILLSLLGQQRGLGQTVPTLRAAAAVCPPIDLELCSRALSSLRNLHIDQYFTWRMVRHAKERRARFPNAHLPRFPHLLNLRGFDEIYTSREAGFKDRDDYYRSCSALKSINAIELPTLVIAAKDDPFIPAQSFKREAFSEAVELRLESSGGHMGFIAKDLTAFGDRRWMDAAIVHWAEAAIGRST